MTLFKKMLFVGACGFSLAATSSASIAEDSKDPIKIITNNWTSQLVLANVVGQVLQSQGYNWPAAGSVDTHLS